MEDVARRAAHARRGEEKILAAAGPVGGAPSEIYGILTNADFPYPSVTLSDGRTVKIDQAAFADLRALPVRADREKVMAAYFKALGGFSRTFGTTMNGEAQKVLFFAKTRKYPTAVEMALDGANIPVSVYTRLVDGVNRNLPAFHRYLTLRKRVLGLDELHYYDLYAPLVGSVKLEYSPEEAQKLVLDAVAPLGADYQATIQRAFKDRWIDLLPTRQALRRLLERRRLRRAPVHADQLQREVPTSARSRTSSATRCRAISTSFQPYPLAGIRFRAEVASTFNESLLIDHVLKNIKDDDTRLALLGTT